MVQHRRMRKAMLILTSIMASVTLFCGYLQSMYPLLSMWGTISNILICLLTGCAVGYVQSVIGYYTEKRNSILIFYKNIAIMYIKIDQTHALCRRCHDERTTYTGMIGITDFFYDDVKTSYYSIDHNSRSKQISACKDVFLAFHEIINDIELLKSYLVECIDFADYEAKTMDKDSNEFKARIQELDKVNKQGNECFAKFYGDDFTATRRSAISVIEDYLFGKSTNDFPADIMVLSESDFLSPRLK